MTTCRNCVAQLLGACDGDYCHAERVGLIEQVERLAADRGHTLSPFEKTKGHPLWTAHCEVCGLQVMYTLDPEPGVMAIHGDLIESDCSGALSGGL